MNGIERIAAERQRQIDSEGYTPEHDQHHRDGALAYAAACYAAPGPIYHVLEGSSLGRDGVAVHELRWHEPWPTGWRRATMPDAAPHERRIRQLEKAGALIAAEIDRLLAVHHG